MYINQKNSLSWICRGTSIETEHGVIVTPQAWLNSGAEEKIIAIKYFGKYEWLEETFDEPLQLKVRADSLGTSINVRGTISLTSRSKTINFDIY